MNWRGTPLVDLATIVSLIGSTHSRSGLRVRSELDRGRYPGGRHRHRRAAGDASASSAIASTATGTTRFTRPRNRQSQQLFLTGPSWPACRCGGCWRRCRPMSWCDASTSITSPTRSHLRRPTRSCKKDRSGWGIGSRHSSSVGFPVHHLGGVAGLLGREDQEH